jgi:hypothetical protein
VRMVESINRIAPEPHLLHSHPIGILAKAEKKVVGMAL